MKPYHLFILLPFIVACKSIEFPTDTCKKVLGKWQLVSKTGGITGKTTLIPKEQTTTLVFKKTGDCVQQVKEESHTKKYSFSIGKSIQNSSERNDLIEYQEGSRIVKQSFQLRGADTLILSDECHDCFQYVYRRDR